MGYSAGDTSTLADDNLAGRPLNRPFSICVQVIGLIIIFVGILGNDLLLIILFRRRQEKKIRNIFIGNLAVADLAILCLCMPYFVLDLVAGHHPVTNPMHCKLNGGLLSLCYTVSILSLLMISYHRYIKVCHRSKVQTLMAPFRNYTTCIILWVLAVIINVPILIWQQPMYGYDPRSHLCNALAKVTHPHYGNVAMICLLLIPLVVIAFFNLAIYNHFSGSRQKLKNARKRSKVAKATWKSFLSVSLNNLTNLDECSDIHRDSSTMDGRLESRHHLGDRFSDLMPSTAAAMLPDGDIELQDMAARKQPQKPVLKRWEAFMNGRDSEQTVKPAVMPRTKFAVQSDSTHQDSETTTSSSKETRFQKPASKGRRASLLCEALDLTTTHPAPQSPTPAPGTSSNGVGCAQGNDAPSPRLQCRIFAELLNQFNTNPKPSSGAANRQNGDAETETEAGTGTEAKAGVEVSVPTATVKVLKWMDSEETDTNSEPAYPSTAQAKTSSKPCSAMLDRKSLYPSIDRAGQFLQARRKLRQRKTLRTDSSLVTSLLLIYICVFVCYTPFIVTLILTFFLQDGVPAELFVASSLMLFFNSAVNWIIYGAMNTAYRQDYLNTLNDFRGCFHGSLRQRSATANESSLDPVSHCEELSAVCESVV